MLIACDLFSKTLYGIIMCVGLSLFIYLGWHSLFFNIYLWVNEYNNEIFVHDNGDALFQQEHFQEDFRMWMTMLCTCAIFKNTNSISGYEIELDMRLCDKVMFEYFSLSPKATAINGTHTTNVYRIKFENWWWVGCV